MSDKKVVKCFNEDIHRSYSGIGHILMIFDKDGAIYAHCNHKACKRWTKLEISFPGIKLDFSKAAIIQKLMPAGYHFDMDKAAVVFADKG